MYEFVQYTLLSVSLVLTLIFASVLVLLCIRTRSKGLIIIATVLVYPSTLGLIQNYILRLYVDVWVGGELNQWTLPMTIEKSLMLYDLLMRLIRDGLLVLGAFLLYQDWNNGKIPWLQNKSPEIDNHV